MASYHLLWLDEPTNHLDMEGKRELAAALAAFDGGFILVSHDRELIEHSCNRFGQSATGACRNCPMLKARIEICSHLVLPRRLSRFRLHRTTPAFSPQAVTLRHSGSGGVSWRRYWRQKSHANRNIRSRNDRNSGGKKCGDWNRSLGFKAYVTGAVRSSAAASGWPYAGTGLVPLGAVCRQYPAIPHPLHFLLERMADIEKLECPFLVDRCRLRVAGRWPAEFGCGFNTSMPALAVSFLQ